MKFEPEEANPENFLLEAGSRNHSFRVPTCFRNFPEFRACRWASFCTKQVNSVAPKESYSVEKCPRTHKKSENQQSLKKAAEQGRARSSKEGTCGNSEQPGRIDQNDDIKVSMRFSKPKKQARLSASRPPDIMSLHEHSLHPVVIHEQLSRIS